MIILNCKKELPIPQLNTVFGAVGKKGTSPILSGVMVEIEDGLVNFTATNSKIKIKSSISLDSGIGEKALFAVDAKKLRNALHSLPNGAEVKFYLEDNKLHLASGKISFYMQTIPTNDFPAMSTSTSTSKMKFTLEQGKFKEKLNLVQYAMAYQDVRRYLNGLLLSNKENKLCAVATDGHRLAYTHIEHNDQSDSHSAIIPRKTVAKLLRLLSDKPDPLLIQFTDEHVLFKFGSIELTTNVIDGKFPDYIKVIPKSFKNKAIINRQDFINSLNCAAVLTNKIHSDARLFLENNTIKIVSGNNFTEEASAEFDIDYSGEKFEVLFNIKYLLEVLENITSNEIIFNFNDSFECSMVSMPDKKEFKYFVMPLRH